MGIHFEAGESIMLRVQGFADQSTDFPNHINMKLDNLNKGRHTIHFGGEYDSKVLVPIVDIEKE